MTAPQRQIAELEKWWHDQSAREAEAVVPKAHEYGSNSLLKMGLLVARLQSRDPATVSDEEALELGCFIYSYGKMLRWEDAVLRQERPSDDTLHDIGVYTKMAQRIRYAGTWPGEGEKETTQWD